MIYDLLSSGQLSTVQISRPMLIKIDEWVIICSYLEIQNVTHSPVIKELKYTTLYLIEISVKCKD